MSIERTFSIIKPDAVAKNVIGQIYSRFEQAGLKIIASQYRLLSQAEAEGFYAVHRERPFFADLVKFMTSGPVMLQVLQGENAIAVNRELMGATNPQEATPGTIRADFAESIDANAVHGSDAPETAAVEIAYFFSGCIHSRQTEFLMPLTLNQPLVNLLDLDEVGLRKFFSGISEKPFRATQVMKWIYHHGVTDFNEMTDLGKDLRMRLGSLACIELPKILKEQHSSDGTVKWMLGLPGGNAVETVFIPEPGRGTLCISSQVGCALNCTFCSTATQGFSRNLMTSEIIGQVFLAAKSLGHERNGKRAITNVVMMGMGEPLLNFEALAPALNLMRDDLGYGFASRRVTVSTAGVVPMIDRLRETADVALAVSLHAPVDDLRVKLVPLNKKYPIKELMAACQRYVAGRNKCQVTFEYTMMDQINDSPEHARQLVKLLRRVPSKLNIIPFNPYPGARYSCSTPERIEAFKQIVMRGGLIATVRKTRGEDIDAACGQLVGKVLDRTRRQAAHNARLTG